MTTGIVFNMVGHKIGLTVWPSPSRRKHLDTIQLWLFDGDVVLTNEVILVHHLLYLPLVCGAVRVVILVAAALQPLEQDLRTLLVRLLPHVLHHQPDISRIWWEIHLIYK